MPLMRHLIVEGSSSSVDNGGGRRISYHTLYLPNAVHETSQQCFATDGALLADMLGRQPSVIAAFKDVPNILFVQAGQNDLRSTDASAWLAAFAGYLATFQDAIKSSRKIVQLGISTHNPRNEGLFNVNRATADGGCDVFRVKESATLLSIGLPIRPGALTPLPQTKLYTLTARILRRADKATWRQITFDLRSTPSFLSLDSS